MSEIENNDKLAKLREAVKSVVSFDTGDVIRFKATYPDSPTVYNYAAIYSGRRWFFTGTRNNVGTDGLSTSAFLRLLSGQSDVLRNAFIHDVELATAWATV